MTHAGSRFRFGAPGCSRADRRGVLHPAKQRPERKTDAAVVLMMAVGRAMAEGDGGTTNLDAFLAAPIFA